jgi:acetyl esterase
MRRIGTLLRRMPGASIASATPEQIERSSGASAPELIASILQGTKPRGVASEDRTVEGVPVRIYTPSADGTGRPLIVYFHGGGFVYGDLRGGDWICGTVAKELDAIVVSVEYRLAPKHPFPAGIDDCYSALVWAAANAASLGADADRLGVMGESAGGNLAAVVALMARDRGDAVIHHQALLYPVTGARDTESRRANADAFILTAADMKKFDELYAGDPGDWRVSPIKAKSLSGLPPAIVVVGGHALRRRAPGGWCRGAADRLPGDAARLPEFPEVRPGCGARDRGGRLGPARGAHWPELDRRALRTRPTNSRGRRISRPFHGFMGVRSVSSLTRISASTAITRSRMRLSS